MKWVDRNYKNPPYGYIIVWEKGTSPTVIYYDGRDKILGILNKYTFTHWMKIQIPKPPKLKPQPIITTISETGESELEKAYLLGEYK